MKLTKVDSDNFKPGPHTLKLVNGDELMVMLKGIDVDNQNLVVSHVRQVVIANEATALIPYILTASSSAMISISAEDILFFSESLEGSATAYQKLVEGE